MAEKSAALVEVDAAVALKHMYRAIENCESLLHPVRHVHKFVWVKALSKSDVIPARLQKEPNLSIPFNKINYSLAIGLKKSCPNSFSFLHHQE